MNRRRGRRFTAHESDPSRAIPVLEAIAPNATVLVIIPPADGLHERNNIEALLLPHMRRSEEFRGNGGYYSDTSKQITVHQRKNRRGATVRYDPLGKKGVAA
jgi:hypothetical protein